HLSNKFGFSLINLPIGIDSPLERLTKIHVAMNNLNSSYQPNLSFGLMNFLGTVPKLVQKNIVNQLSKKASSTISNIPGPSHPLFFAGKEITEFVYWVAQTGHLGLGISLLSYNHQISVGVIADPNLIQNPSVITDGLTIHFEELKDILKKQ
ncbi:MAG: diacylglycerol O-acyltransferase, partial [bacterium]